MPFNDVDCVLALTAHRSAIAECVQGINVAERHDQPLSDRRLATKAYKRADVDFVHSRAFGIVWRSSLGCATIL